MKLVKFLYLILFITLCYLAFDEKPMWFSIQMLLLFFGKSSVESLFTFLAANFIYRVGKPVLFNIILPFFI